MAERQCQKRGSYQQGSEPVPCELAPILRNAISDLRDLEDRLDDAGKKGTERMVRTDEQIAITTLTRQLAEAQAENERLKREYDALVQQAHGKYGLRARANVAERELAEARTEIAMLNLLAQKYRIERDDRSNLSSGGDVPHINRARAEVSPEPNAITIMQKLMQAGPEIIEPEPREEPNHE